MSVNNTPDPKRKETYLRVRASFIARGTTLNEWCRSNGLHIQNVRDAFFGRWKGEGADALVARTLDAAGLAK